ncbi:MAG: mechanosensitive ion channel family protein [Nitrososphaerota archaeon]|nr:mechanosensitive ion channel family protein [Nitrososphaerota archaeon]
MKPNYTRLLAFSVGLVVLLIAVGALFYYALYIYRLIPFSMSEIIELVLAVVLGYVVITFLAREIRSLATKVMGPRKGNAVFTTFRFFAYIVLAIVLLSIVGLTGQELLAGGTFAGLVLGLAGQTVLSNIMAGTMLILSRPYEVGDRVTFSTWQFGMIAPIYPPKFYSNDYLIPGYTGTVADIGLLYSVVRADEGTSMKIPNSIMIQAAIVSHDVKERWVRTRYEVPASIDPKSLIEELKSALATNEWIANPDSIHILVNTTTLSSYVITIDAACKGAFEEPPRSAILLLIMQKVAELKETKSST